MRGTLRLSSVLLSLINLNYLILPINKVNYIDIQMILTCVFISFHHKGFSWLYKTRNIIPEFRLALLTWGNNSVPSTFVTTS